MYSRRDFNKLALAGLPAAAWAAKIDSKFNGVVIGAQSYSFRDMPFLQAIDAMKQIGIGEVELWAGHLEPKEQKGSAGRELVREWRLSTPMDFFHDARKKLDDAGIELFAYCVNFKDDWTPEELDRGFQMTRALGVNLITSSTTLTCAPRLAPLAEKYKMKVAMHGHDETSKPNEFSTPETFAKALEMSKNFRINLDIGHFTAAGYDPVQYIQEHHDKILCLHIKDRKKDHGANLPFGEGETPIKQVLQLLKTKHYKIPANIEYEYGKEGLDTVTEVKRCFEYCKEAVA